jgi:hypothetical protein
MIGGAASPTHNHFNIIQDNEYVTGVILPSSLTGIGNYAFSGCSSLTDVTRLTGSINNIITIGQSAFEGCSNLTSLTILLQGSINSIITIGESAFSGCTSLTSLERITLLRDSSNSIITIGDGAFSGCTGLTTVAIPDGVTSIGDGAFSGCSNLTAFTVSENNTAYYAGSDGILYNVAKTKVIRVPLTKTGDISLLGTINSVGAKAFEGCSSITSVTAPKTVGTTDHLFTIGESAFEGCSNLNGLSVDDDADADALLISLGDRAFFGCSNFSLVDDALPPGSRFTSIGESALENCSSLTGVTIGENVDSIADRAFFGCRSLVKIVKLTLTTPPSLTYAVGMPDSVKSMGASAFSGCRLLTYNTTTSNTGMTIGTGVESIGASAFEGCTALTIVTIPAHVTSIGLKAFYGSGLTKVSFAPSNITKWNANAFPHNSSNSLWDAYDANGDGVAVKTYNLTTDPDTDIWS